MGYTLLTKNYLIQRFLKIGLKNGNLRTVLADFERHLLVDGIRFYIKNLELEKLALPQQIKFELPLFKTLSSH